MEVSGIQSTVSCMSIQDMFYLHSKAITAARGREELQMRCWRLKNLIIRPLNTLHQHQCSQKAKI